MKGRRRRPFFIALYTESLLKGSFGLAGITQIVGVQGREPDLVASVCRRLVFLRRAARHDLQRVVGQGRLPDDGAKRHR